MRRSEVVVVPPGGGRDAGKHFKITETDAFKAEWWAYRLGIAVKGTTAQLPDAVARMGMVGITTRLLNGVLASDINPNSIKPLLDEMMECVLIVRDASARDKLTGEVIATALVGQDDIEEVWTIGWLRSEVIRVHTGFSVAEGLSRLLSADTPPTGDSPTT